MTTSDVRFGHQLDEAPPLAPEIGPRQRRAAVRSGRRSAGTTAPDAEGHHPATRAMAAETAQLEAQIHTALVRAVESLDRQIAPAEAEIRLLTTGLPLEPAPLDPKPSGSLTAVQQEDVRAKEDAWRRTSARRSAMRQRLEQLQQKVAELSQEREHLHSTAAGILDSWVARFDHLVAYHREGYVRALTRRFFAASLTVKDPQNLPLPSYRPSHPWTAGEQLPVTFTEVHAEQQPALRWGHLIWEFQNSATPAREIP